MEILGQETVNEFVSVGTYVAVAARKSEGAVWVVDPFWIIKITDKNRIDFHNPSVDNFGFEIKRKQLHLAGNFLEKNERLTTEKKKGF